MEISLRKLLLIAFIFSGMAALIYEITWIRPLQFIFGSTTYTISIIFAVFMGGLALGSGVASKYIDTIRNLPKTYALFEVGIGIYGVLLLSIFSILPSIYDNLYYLHTNFYLFEIVQFIIIFLVLLVPTTLMGATFPIIVKYYTEQRIGKAVGEVYAANNLGAIIGSFIAGFILIPLLGIKATIIFAGVINILIGGIIIAKNDKDYFKKTITPFLILFVILAFLGNYNIKQLHSNDLLGEVVYYEEGLYATVMVRELPERGYALFFNGYGQGGYEIQDLRVNFLLSYLPKLINPKIDNALIIGLGTGMTAGQLAQFTNTTTVEIEPKVIGAVRFFDIFNRGVLENENHTLIMGDARNYLLKNEKKYNIIVAEPTNTWQSFSTQLYSKEFLELAAEDLNEGGLFVKWVPIYTMSVGDFRSFYKTFNSVFPYNAAFANIKSDENTPVKFETSEIILVGSKTKLEINGSLFENNYKSLQEVSKIYLDSIGLSSGKEVYHLLLFTSGKMEDYAKNSEFVTDDNLLLEFSTAKNRLNQNSKEVLNDIEEFISK